MSDVRIGELIATKPHRDAVHCAVAPAVSADVLKPGRHVILVPRPTTSGRRRFNLGEQAEPTAANNTWHDDPQVVTVKLPMAPITALAIATGITVGIVDPFLTADVPAGRLFWLFLYPRTVTGMSHHWSHPAFPELGPPPPAVNPADDQWLRTFAMECDLLYEELMSGADAWVASQVSLNRGEQT